MTKPGRRPFRSCAALNATRNDWPTGWKSMTQQLSHNGYERSEPIYSPKAWNAPDARRVVATVIRCAPTWMIGTLLGVFTETRWMTRSDTLPSLVENTHRLRRQVNRAMCRIPTAFCRLFERYLDHWAGCWLSTTIRPNRAPP